jgi:putative nucleotidyltransferase with HDIG domain
LSMPPKRSPKPAKPVKAKAVKPKAVRTRLAKPDAGLEASLALALSENEMLQAKLQVMREVTRVAAGEFSMDEALELFMDVVLQYTRTDAGSLLLLSPDGKELVFKVARGPKASGLLGRRMPAHDGICGWVAQHGQSVISGEPSRDRRHNVAMAKELGYAAENILAVPLKGRDRVLGVVELFNRRDGKNFIDEDLNALEAISVPIAQVVENATLFLRHQDEIRKLTSLIEVSEALNSTLDLKRLLKLSMDLAARSLQAEASSILLKDEATGDLVFEVATGEAGDAMKLIRVPVGEGIAGWVAQHQKSILVDDVQADPRFFKKADEKSKFVTKSIVAVPLTLQGRLIGVAEALNKREGVFTEDDLRLLEALGHQSAIAIQNARLYADLQDSFLATVRSLVQAIDAKDPYTAGHATRVTEYATAIAVEMGLDAESLDRVRQAALMHDVGKIGVPEAILCKPGRLTDEEYTQMKKHPSVGAGILRPMSRLAQVIPGIQQHHEHYDGHGYPDGLKGEDISLDGRIIGVADTFDAMTSNRVYRPRLSDEAALDELRRFAGRQFDPKVVEVFLLAYKNGRIKTQPQG